MKIYVLGTLIILPLFVITSACSNSEPAGGKSKSAVSKHKHGKNEAKDAHAKKGHDEKHKHGKNEGKDVHAKKGHDEKHEHGKNESKDAHAKKGHDEKHEHGKSEAKDAHGKKKGGHGGHEEEPKMVKLTATQRAQIKLKVLNSTSAGNGNSSKIRTTGEVKLNRYKSAEIAPRIQAQIIKRLVKNGDHVVKGQPLVILSSVEMAKAQGDLLLAEQEWKRIKSLGTQIVSSRRYSEVRTKRTIASAKVLAFGMSKKQLKAWRKTPTGANATGQFSLVSTISGTVVYDDFIEGQVVEASKKLMQITDESNIWVVATIKPQGLKHLKVGYKAQVSRNNITFEAKIIRLPHVIDEKTRTAPVTLEVINKNDVLHAGEFVSVVIYASSEHNRGSLTLPVGAVVRNSKGDWQVFVEKQPNVFYPVKVKIIKNQDGNAIVTGVSASDKVVINGTFFLQSELAKGGFDIHNH